MLVYPNYKKCIVNVIASIKRYYRIPTEVPTIASLDEELNRMYKNVVLIVLCGAGENMLRKILRRDDILVRNMKESLTSVFPAYPSVTDVSCISGLYPMEHGRLGQTMFFKELCRTVELSTNLDPYSSQNVSVGNAADFLLPYKNIFGEIADSIIGGVQPFSIAMPGVKIAENKSYHKTADNPKRMFELIKKIAETDQNTFTYVQWNAVRDAAVLYGCESEQVTGIMRDLNDTIDGLCRNLSDTLFIVTSDHGMTDISSEVMLNLKYDICNCLIMPPTFGRRTVNFFVKHEKRSEFERLFSEELGEDFILMDRSEMFEKMLFGYGKPCRMTDDFVGDYCAVATGDKTIRYRALNEKHRSADKASFGGITEDEMVLPLSVISSDRTAKRRVPFFENIAPLSFTKKG